MTRSVAPRIAKTLFPVLTSKPRWVTFLLLGCRTRLGFIHHLVCSAHFFFCRLSVESLLDNYPAPYKRPLSSMIPTIIEHPKTSFLLSIGGSGGSRILSAVYQVI